MILKWFDPLSCSAKEYMQAWICLHELFLMKKTKDQMSWVSSHDVYWETKMYKRKRSVMAQGLSWRHKSIQSKGPLLESPGNFSARKVMAKSWTSRLQSCFIHAFLFWRDVPFIQDVSGVYTSPFLDTDQLKMALRARKVSRSFEKQPGPRSERQGTNTCVVSTQSDPLDSVLSEVVSLVLLSQVEMDRGHL